MSSTDTMANAFGGGSTADTEAEQQRTKTPFRLGLITLKIKAETLALESRRIRAEEERWARKLRKVQAKVNQAHAKRWKAYNELLNEMGFVAFNENEEPIKSLTRLRPTETLEDDEREAVQKLRASWKAGDPLPKFTSLELYAVPSKKATESIARVEGLWEHRTQKIRPEARATNLAYGFLRGREYHQIENRAYDPPEWTKIEDMLDKFGNITGNNEQTERYNAWKASAHFENPVKPEKQKIVRSEEQDAN